MVKEVIILLCLLWSLVAAAIRRLLFGYRAVGTVGPDPPDFDKPYLNYGGKVMPTTLLLVSPLEFSDLPMALGYSCAQVQKSIRAS